MEKRKVSKDEFDRFIKDYPNELERDVAMMFEPPLISYNDFSTGLKWPDSIACFTKHGTDEYFIFTEHEHPKQ